VPELCASLAAELAPKLGQNVIVENRAGAVGNIGLKEIVERAGLAKQ
jgi:tripartite-type tricarboxylate transporter receptor subunit TctC